VAETARWLASGTLMELIEVRRFWPAALAACLGIVASLVAFSYARNTAHERVSAELWVQAETRARDLQEVLSRYEGTVEGFAAAFPYQRLTQEQFHAYAESVFLASSMLRSGFQNLGWAPLVKDRDRAAFEAALAAEHHPGSILEAAPDGSLRKAARRAEYYPLRYVEPERPSAPIALDLASDPVREVALRRAIAGRTAVTTPVVPLYTGDYGNLLYVPIYPNEPGQKSTGVDADTPIGVMTLRLSMSNAIEAIIGAFEPVPQGIDMYVLDDAAAKGERLIYYHPTAGGPADATQRDESVALVQPFWGSSFRFGSRDWTVIVRPTAQLIASRLDGAGTLELGVGLLLTGLLTLYLVATPARAHRLRRLYDALQREVAVRRSTEETLRLTQLGMDHSSEGITLIDRSGQFLNVNDAVCRQLGYTREELLGLTIFDVNTTLDRAIWDQRWEFHKHRGVADSFESERRAKDGTLIPVDLTANHFESNGTEYLFVVARDATTRCNIERELRATRDRAENASQAKSQFLANMSHELRTPLNAIIGFSEVISAALFGPLDARYRDYAQDIHGSGHHLLRIINDLLDLSKIEAGRFELHDAPVPIGALFDNCRRMVCDRAAAGGVSLEFHENGLEVKADELRLQQVLLNFASNAVKFTPAGGRVFVSATLTAAGEVTISVADTGIGMNPEEIPVALQAFRQVDSALARAQGGTGLGLPLAVRLVELHGGAVSITSQPGQGTTVSFTLPAERTHRPRMRGFRRVEASQLPATGTES
jgi:PAS domain S-box-containing protein